MNFRRLERPIPAYSARCIIKKGKEKEINDERDEYGKENARLIYVINLKFREISGN
jgi:hypothetical protein